MDDNKGKQSKSSLFNNWLSYLGFGISVIFIIGETLIIGMDLLRGGGNLYAGVLIYIVGPGILTTGLVMVPFGMWLEHRKRMRGEPSSHMPVLDLGNPQHRIKILIFIAVTISFVIISMVGSYQAYHLTESNQFCGLLCHQVMVPVYAAYQHSPHARVNCVQCHIGAGADWYVKSKISGAHQVYAVLTKSYELPIKTPITNLRPARDTCEQCHWPEKFYQSVEKQMVYFGSDEKNTPYRVDLLLKVGKDPLSKDDKKSIHWHLGMDHTIEYYAKDEKRQDIPWIRLKFKDGRVQEFVKEDAKDFDPAKIPQDKIRVMDCMDCHNRPSHHYNSPQVAINEAMKQNLIDPQIPGIKALLVDLMGKKYNTTKEGLDAIEKTIQEKYKDRIQEKPELKEPVDKAITETKKLFEWNIFPEWKTNWEGHVLNIGHFDFPGCYRCHDDKHKTKDGAKISNDCNLCHTIVRQGEGWEELVNLEYKKQEFKHPRGYGDDWKGQNCHECHSG